MEAGKKSQSQSYSLSAAPGLSYVTPANLEVPAWKFLPGSLLEVLNIFP